MEPTIRLQIGPEDYRVEGWLHVCSADEGIRLLRRGGVAEVMLDEDLGDEHAGTGYQLARVVEEGAALGWLRPVAWSTEVGTVGTGRMRIALESASRWWKRPAELPVFEGHVVLLGGSVFDNGLCAAPDPSVAEHLRSRLGPRGEVTLLARAGAVTSDVARQLEAVPHHATHLVVAPSSGAQSQQAERVFEFEHEFEQMLQRLLARDLPVYVCTVYRPASEDPLARRAAEFMIKPYNEVIRRLAAMYGLGLVDVDGYVCMNDLTHESEPSGEGGAKIAGAVAMSVSGRTRRH